MILRLTLLMSFALALLAAPATAAGPSAGWTSESDFGSVYVSGDRQHILVCDLADDRYSIEGEYATSLLGTYTVAVDNGTRSGCVSDRTYISRIDVFKMCFIENGLRRCHNPV